MKISQDYPQDYSELVMRLAKDFAKNGKRMALWLNEEKGEYRWIDKITIATLTKISQKINNISLKIQYNSQVIKIFRVNKTEITNEAPFGWDFALFPVLELEFEDGDFPNVFWIGVIQGKKNIKEFVRYVTGFLNLLQ